MLIIDFHYFPAYYFETKDSIGVRQFNLINGGIAANNPVFEIFILNLNNFNFQTSNESLRLPLIK